MKNTTKKKSQIIANRIPHFLAPEEGESPRRFIIQAALNAGELRFFKTTEKIWESVRGSRHGNEGQFVDMGIRKFAACHYLLHLEGDVVTGIDIIPARYFVRGATPRCASAAIKKGLTLVPGESFEGYEVINENMTERDKEDQDSFRLGYLGLTERALVTFLVAFRDSGFAQGTAAAQLINDHQVKRLPDGNFLMVPTPAIIKSKAQPRSVGG
jgi:hypothetical protein